ncbi:hypothetical protein [Nocardia sp. NPDC004260]
MTVRDLFTIASRLGWLLDLRRFPATPLPWKRCHCGALADYYDGLAGGVWCWPCKYAMHETCECSDPATWGPNGETSDSLGAVTPLPAAEGGRPGGEAAVPPAAPRRDVPDEQTAAMRRWYDALFQIADNPCSNGDAAFSCSDLPISRAEWCSYCIAYDALNPSSPAGVSPGGEVAHPESPSAGDHGDSGCAPNFPS